MNQPDLNNSFPTRNGMDAPATIYTLGDLQQGPPCCIPTPILDIQDLRVAYNGVVALDDLSLQINKNCITALIGPSGCGKTSFLSTLNRLTDLVPNAAIRGKIYFEGQDIHDKQIDVRVL